VLGLVVSTSLLLLVMQARMKGGWVMSVDSLMTLLMAWRAWSAIVALSVTFSPRVIITSLSARGRALGMIVVGVFFFLCSTVVKGFSSWVHSAIPLRWSAQVWLWVPFQSASHSLGTGACRGIAGVGAGGAAGPPHSGLALVGLLAWGLAGCRCSLRTSAVS
jgi:hypothetical protein